MVFRDTYSEKQVKKWDNQKVLRDKMAKGEYRKRKRSTGHKRIPNRAVSSSSGLSLGSAEFVERLVRGEKVKSGYLVPSESGPKTARNESGIQDSENTAEAQSIIGLFYRLQL